MKSLIRILISIGIVVVTVAMWGQPLSQPHGSKATIVENMTNQFAALHDRTNYLQKSAVNAQGEQLQVTTNSAYTPVGP
jgi:hypothetical protein